MRIIFLGTPDFSVSCLDALIQSKHDVVAVVTQPDRQETEWSLHTHPLRRKH